MNGSQIPRRGRPPIQDRQDVAKTSDQDRRLRMRLAQRSYRARKQEAQKSKKGRVEELSDALDSALATFSKLHQDILANTELRNSADLALHLNDAVSQMKSIASATNKALPPPQAPRSPNPVSLRQEPWEVHDDWSLDPFWDVSGVVAPVPRIPADSGLAISLRTNTSILIPLSARLVRASLQRVLSLLPRANGSHPPLALALPLQLLDEADIVAFALQELSVFHSFVVDFQYPLTFASQNPYLQPHMYYRVVEGGGSGVFPRAPSPRVQQLVRGRTRTVLNTSFVPLRGEWLEAVDVEEYLEDRGIYLRGSISTDTAHQTRIPNSEQYTPPPSTPPGAATSWEVARAGRDNTQKPLNVTKQLAFDMSTSHSGHEPEDYMVFGLPSPRRPARSANSQTGPIPPPGILTTIMPSVSQTGFNPQAAQAAARGLHITVDIDKLVHLLAESAVCLGPAPGIQKAAIDASIRASII